MPTKRTPAPNPSAQLADKLVRLLEAQRQSGSGPNSPTLRQLLEPIDPPPSPEALAKAVKHARFKGRAIIALKDKSNLASLVALKEDVGPLAASPVVLEQALETLCTPENRTASLAAVKKLLDPAVAKLLATAIKERMAQGTLPQAVGLRTVGRRQELYLKRLPPLMPEEQLSQSLVEVLNSQRSLGPDSYPPTLSRLIELCGSRTTKLLVTKACMRAPFADHASIAGKKTPAALVFLREDQDKVLSSPRLWEALMHAARGKGKKQTDGFAFPKLKKELVLELQPAFAAVAEQGPPAGIGWLWMVGEKTYFLLNAVQGGKIAAPTEPSAPPPPKPSTVLSLAVDYARAFTEAFDRLDRHEGGHNFVSLVDLRRAIPCDRATFDAELRKLRIAGRFTLSAAEGRHGITPEQQQAGILEEGSLLLNVHRKSP